MTRVDPAAFSNNRPLLQWPVCLLIFPFIPLVPVSPALLDGSRKACYCVSASVVQSDHNYLLKGRKGHLKPGQIFNCFILFKFYSFPDWVIGYPIQTFPVLSNMLYIKQTPANSQPLSELCIRTPQNSFNFVTKYLLIY